MNDQATYEISVMGVLGERWAEWFPDMGFTQDVQHGLPVTHIRGPVQDQSGLLGMLQTLVNLGLHILLVRRVEWE
jgi:hypothetical protein